MYKEIIDRNCSRYSIKPELIASIIMKESSGNVDAMRFEPKFYENRLKGKRLTDLAGHKPDRRLVSEATEIFSRACSWGLMQVLGETARSIGMYEGLFLSSLRNPEEGIAVGCKVYAHYYKITLSDKSALCMYNAGSIASLAGKNYADSVMKILNEKSYRSIYG